MPDDVEAADAPPIAIVGAGAVGTVLARRLVGRGLPVQAILSRQQKTAQTLAERVGASVGSADWTALPSPVRLVLVCVPDDAIGDVAESLAALNHPWSKTIVGHTSGACSAAVLAPLSQEGAAVFSFHPLQTFLPDTSPEALENTLIGLEGDAKAVAAGEALAQALGARSVTLSAEQKARYHCAASLASNGLVALMAVVQEVFASAGIDESSSLEAVAPLVEQTWTNVKSGTPEGALTGPVARGDHETVQKHLDALAETSPHLVPLYAALATEMARIAVQSGRLDSETAEGLLQTLQTALDASSEGAYSVPLH